MSASNKNIFNLAIRRCNWSVTVSMRDMLKSFVSVMLQLMLLIMLKIMLMMSLVMLKMMLMMFLMMLIATWQRCLGGWSGFLPDSSSPELISSYLNLSLISSRYEGSQPLIHLSSHSISHTISHRIMLIWQQWGPTLATSIAALRRSRIARALGLSLVMKILLLPSKI